MSRRTVWIRSRCYLKKKLISDFWGNMKMCRNLPLSYGTDQQVVIAPNQEKYRNLLENGYSFQELLSEPFILRELTDDTEEDEDRFLEEQGVDLSKLHVAAKIHDKEIMKRSVSMGMGIASCR